MYRVGSRKTISYLQHYTIGLSCPLDYLTLSEYIRVQPFLLPLAMKQDLGCSNTSVVCNYKPIVSPLCERFVEDWIDM
jgi:hypothetical protein